MNKSYIALYFASEMVYFGVGQRLSNILDENELSEEFLDRVKTSYKISSELHSVLSSLLIDLNNIELDNKDILELLENSDLNNICAFRMAAKDIRAGRIDSAKSRIKSDLDKVTGEQRKVLSAFINE